ncbi:MAG: CapA family protein, partial [Alistipes sp.]|nr:CapA family protein [Alistipes sp.]
MAQTSNVVICRNRVEIEGIDVGQFETLSLSTRRGSVGTTGILTLPAYGIGITESGKSSNQQTVVARGTAKRRVRSKIEYVRNTQKKNNAQYHKTKYHTKAVKSSRRSGKVNLFFVFTTTLAISLVVGFLGIFFMMSKEEQEISVIDFLIHEKEIITETFVDEEPTALSEEPEGWQIETADDEVTLLFAGDVLLDDSYAVMSTFWNNGGTIQNAFSANLIQEMQSADIFMLNNEFTFTNRGTATAGKRFTFRAKPDNVSFLKDIGTDIVSVANNH